MEAKRAKCAKGGQGGTIDMGCLADLGYLSGFHPQLYPKAASNPQTPASSSASVAVLEQERIAPHFHDPPVYREDQWKSLYANRHRNPIAYDIAGASLNATMNGYKHECLEQRRQDAAEYHRSRRTRDCLDEAHDNGNSRGIGPG